MARRTADGDERDTHSRRRHRRPRKYAGVAKRVKTRTNRRERRESKSVIRKQLSGIG